MLLSRPNCMKGYVVENLAAMITALFHDVLETQGGTLKSPLTEASILLETGLDSLGFAILVARLEQELGYDPFVLMDTPVYPVTFGEFVAIYQKFSSHGRS